MPSSAMRQPILPFDAVPPAPAGVLEAQAMTVPRPQSLAAVGKLYAENTAKYQAMAKSMNLQPQ